MYIHTHIICGYFLLTPRWIHVGKHFGWLFSADGDIESALKKGFLDLDLQMLADDEMKQEMSGTTAVIVLIKNKTIYCGIIFAVINNFS